MNRHVRIDIAITTQTDSGTVRSIRETFNVHTDDPHIVAQAFLANLNGAQQDIKEALCEENDAGELVALSTDLLVVGSDSAPDPRAN